MRLGPFSLLLATFLFWIPILRADPLPQCFDLMSVGFALTPMVYSRDEAPTEFHELTLPRIKKTFDYVHDEAKTVSKAYNELRRRIAETLHLHEFVEIQTYRLYQGEVVSYENPNESKYRSELIEFDHWGLWHRGVFGLRRPIASFDELFRGQKRVILSNFRWDMSPTKDSDFKNYNPDRRIANLMSEGYFAFVDLNLKNETPDSIRGFFYYYLEAQVYFRRGGVFRSIKAKKEKVEIARNGDLFVNREFLFNIDAISMEESSFFHMRLQKSTDPTVKPFNKFIVNDEIRMR